MNADRVHRLQTALAQSDRLLNTLLTAAPIGFCYLDRDLRYVLINERLAEINGLSAAAHIGKRVDEIVPKLAGSVRQVVDAILETGEAVTGKEFSGETAAAPGVTRYWNESWYPVRDDSGAIVGFGVVVEEITQRKRAEQDLRRNHEELLTLVDLIPAYIWVAHDPNCRVITGNRAANELMGVKADTNVSQTSVARGEARYLRQLKPDGSEYRPDELPLQRTVATGKPVRETYIEFCLDDGSRRHAVGEAAPLFDDNGAVRGGVAAFFDITERVRAEAALREADRRKDEFLAMLGHELRNPLAPIQSATAFLARTLPNDEAVRAPLAMITRQTLHLTRLVDDLLDVARIAGGRIDLKPELLEIRTILDEVFDVVQPLMAGKRHRLHVHRPQEKLYVRGDRSRLVQALGNVLHNAAKYTDAEGEITLEVRASGDQIDIEVRDTGAGISPELLPRVFDLFVQGERTLDRAEGGLGLGLSVTRRLIEAHGGTVEARSDGPGCGSAFTVSLPRSPAPEPQSASPPRPSRTERRRILVVDDNVDAADSFAMFLRLDGHEVETVYDGPAALTAIAAREPEVVFLDIGMSQMDGYEVARRLRNNGTAAVNRIRLIAVTGYGQEVDRARAEKAGFDAHLVKPADPDAVARILRRSRPDDADPLTP